MIAQTVREAAQVLRLAGVPTAQQAAEELLAGVLGCGRLDIYLRTDVTPAQVRQFQQWVQVRSSHVPTQYVTGHVRFWGLDFEVTPATLIPRPETELVVTQALTHARRCWPADKSIKTIDIGTGCGNLAVSLTRELGSATIVAVDASLQALIVARHNATRHGVADRMAYVQSDGLTGLRHEWAPQLVVANPPYIPSSEVSALPLDVQQEPRAALDGGIDGMRVHTMWIQQAARVLQPDGLFVSEMGLGQEQPLIEVARQIGCLRVMAVCADWHGIPRVLIAQKTAATWTN